MKHIAFTAEQLVDLQRRAQEHGFSEKALQRLSLLRHFLEEKRSVTAACRAFGISRVSFYRLLDRFDVSRPETLEDQSTRPHSVRSSVPPRAIALIKDYRKHYPEFSREKIALVLAVEHGISVSHSTIGRVLAAPGGAMHGNEPAAEVCSALEAASPTGVATTGRLSAAPGTVSRHDHCLLCHVRAYGWKGVKRALILGSILSNLALLGFILLVALREGSRAHTLPASLTPATEVRSSTVLP